MIEPRRRHRKKPPITLAHDRRATELPRHARVFVDNVDDPYGYAEGVAEKLVQNSDKATEWRSDGQPQISVVRSLRHDPLASMWARRQIVIGQFRAGRRWQELYERTCVGAVQAVDTTREPVDGGSFPDPLSEAQRRAMIDLKRCAAAVMADKRLGKGAQRLIEDVLAHGLTVAEAASLRAVGVLSQSSLDALRRTFRLGLDTLAITFGLATRDPITKSAKG